MKEKIKNNIKSLENRRNGMKKYLLLKYDEEDWHGCMDASADIREIEAELKCLKMMQEIGSK